MADAKLKYVIAAQDNASISIQGVQRNFQRLDDQVQKSRVQMNQFGGSLVGTQRNLRKFALGGVQQAGYQIGDFAVQVANGTSKVQAFGQQAGQFLQIFGPFGAVLGATVSIISAVVLAKQKAGEAADKAATSIMSLTTAMKNLRTAATEGVTNLRMFIAGITSMEEFVIREKLLSAEEDLLVTETALAKLQKSGAMMGASLLLKKLEKQQKVVNELNDALVDLNINQQSEATLKALKDQETIRTKEAEALKLRNEQIQKGINASKEYTFSRIAGMKLQREAAEESLALEERLLTKTQRANKEFAALMALSQREVQKAFAINGRGSSQGGPSFDELVKNDPRVQLAYERMRLQDEEFKKAQEAAKKTRKMLKHELSPEIKRLISLSESIGQSFENAFMSAVDGTSSFKDAFKSMTRQIISELYRVFVVKRITGFITNAFLGATVGPMQGPNLPGMRFEGGGYTGSGARAGGLDGKGGFMAMLHPNETVIDHTKGQGAGVTVVQNINISTGVQQTVRTEIKSMMPQIAESAKAAVADAKRRGGSYGRAFA